MVKHERTFTMYMKQDEMDFLNKLSKDRGLSKSVIMRLFLQEEMKKDNK